MEMLSRGPCHGYLCKRTGHLINPDPYDYVSGSPIQQPVHYCLYHYNERVLAALDWIMHHARQD